MQEVERELCWIDEPVWNDSLWVEHDYSIELNDKGQFCNRPNLSSTSSDSSDGTDSVGSASNHSKESLPYWSDSECHVHITSHQRWSRKDFHTLKISRNSGTMHNCTDDLKLSMVDSNKRTSLAFRPTVSSAAKISVLLSSHGRGVPGDDKLLSPRERHDYLRRSSPSPSSPSVSSKSSSNGSLVSNLSRKSRSLSPALALQIEAHRADLSRSRYRDCCNRHYQAQEISPKTSPSPHRRLFPSVSSSATRSQHHSNSETRPRSQTSPAGKPTTPVSEKVGSTMPMRRSSFNPLDIVDCSTPAPSTITNKLTKSNSKENKKPRADQHDTSKCRRSCCKTEYQPRPKFDYLRKGSGAKYANHSPKPKNSADVTQSLDKCNKNTRPQSNRNILDNSHTLTACETKSLRHKSPSSLRSSRIPVRNKASHRSSSKDNSLGCDQILLDFPTLYYKLDCSGEVGDVDLESRKSRSGAVYRILDNGDVICESHPENNLYDKAGKLGIW